MLTIELSFPTGRYHATPWNRHVNEGEVEWPPSPWRILRALIANWHLKARDEISEDDVRALVEALASELPRYSIPRAVVAHTRHYMPDGGGKVSKTFDTFVRLPDGARVLVQWPETDLGEEQRAHLSLLLERMSYLGRAESLVEASLVRGDRATDERARAGSWVTPEAQAQGTGQEFLALLAPMSGDALASWRQGVIDQRAADTLRGKRAKKPSARLSAKEQRAIESAVPDNVLSALSAETTALRKQGWNRPPGSQWVTYARDRAVLGTTSGRRKRRVLADEPTIARFAVTSKLAPPLTEALFVAERVRKSLIKLSDGAPVFSGRTDEKELIRGHRHAFILPEANGATSRITHVTVYAEMGFSERAREAIEGLQRVWNKHETITLALLGVGEAAAFAGADTDAGQCPLLMSSRVWVSRTPFVPTRYPKSWRDGRPKEDARGLQIGSPEHDLRRLLRENGYPEPEDISLEPEVWLGGKPVRWAAYRTRRQDGGGRRSRGSIGFRISFAKEDVYGPLCVGYAAHLGLGMFVPDAG